MHGILIHQVVLDGKEAGIVEVRFPRRGILLQRLDDLGFALIESFFAGLAHVQIDEHFVQRGLIVGLDFRILQPRAIQVGANRIHVRRVRKLHVNQRAAAEINAPRNVVPEQHGRIVPLR